MKRTSQQIRRICKFRECRYMEGGGGRDVTTPITEQKPQKKKKRKTYIARV